MQKSVGTVVKTAETDDPIGVATVLNLTRHSTLGSLKELKEFILKQCPSKELKAKLEEVITEPYTSRISGRVTASLIEDIDCSASREGGLQRQGDARNDSSLQNET